MDARTRELERTWRETGDREAAVRYLQSLIRSGAEEAEVLRVRREVGELSEDRLLLAGLLGHLPAQAALGDEVALTTDDLSAIGRVSPGTVRRWVNRLGCPAVKRGGRWQFDAAAVIAWSRQAPQGVVAPTWVEVVGYFCQEALWPLLIGLIRDMAESLPAELGAVREPLEAWCADPTPERAEAVEATLPSSSFALAVAQLRRLPRKWAGQPLYESELHHFFAVGLELDRVRELLLPWALSLDLERAARVRERARLELPPPRGLPVGGVGADGAALLTHLGPPHPGEDVLDWFAGLAQHGAQPVLRAVVAIARRALGPWRQARPADRAGDDVVLGLERCVREPGPTAAGALAASAPSMRSAVLEAGRDGLLGRPLACGWLLVEAAELLNDLTTKPELFEAATLLAKRAVGRGQHPEPVFDPAELRNYVVYELGLWLMGHRPLGADH